MKFDGLPRKTIELLFCATSSFVHRFVAICKKWSYGPETPKNLDKVCFDLCDLELWRLTMTLHGHHICQGNISRKFQDDTMRGT